MNSDFQAKLPKFKNCNISEAMFPVVQNFVTMGGPQLPYMKYNMADVRHQTLAYVA